MLSRSGARHLGRGQCLLRKTYGDQLVVRANDAGSRWHAAIADTESRAVTVVGQNAPSATRWDVSALMNKLGQQQPSLWEGEQRLEEMESSMKLLQQTRSAVHTDSQFANSSLPSAPGSTVPPERSTQYSANAEMGEIDTSEDAIDGMGAIKFTDEEDCGYFGPSSNVAFVRHISLALAKASGQSQTIQTRTTNSSTAGAEWMRVSRPHYVHGEINESNLSHSRRSVNIYALPPDAYTWRLIKEYFQKTGQLLPFIHEESFCETYFQLKRTNFTMARRTWLGLLNMILAMATTLTVDGYTSSEERIAESDVYYQRANGLCERESRTNISLELVQYLLIVGQYLQGTQKSVRAWTVHGLAITTALQLGLHSPRTNRDFPPLESEIRKRVWFGCILLDRTLSMTYGRACMIPEKYVKLELPIADIQVVGQTPSTDARRRMDAMYFRATIALYSVMYQIIDTCYGQNLGLEEYLPVSEIISLTLQGETQLNEWKNQILPSQNLRVCSTPLCSQDLDKLEAKDKIKERFNLVLSLRFHNLHILLHRPILEKLLDVHGGGGGASSGGGGDSETNMMRQVCISSVENCVDSAMIIISIVHTVVLSNGWRRDLLGAWNYSLFYTFNAGLVIIAGLLVSPKETVGGAEDGGDIAPPPPSSQWKFLESSAIYLNMAIEALQNLDRGNRVVQRIVDYLSQLALAVFSLSSRNLDANSILPSVNSYDAFASAGNHPDLLPTTRSSHQTIGQKEFPMEIDLSEFTLDTDLDWFTRHLEPNR
ncbi:uncharacterized protein Z520_05961 [Fonsecaea multimorphosa CBS 102226]|uniref:Xylanolytic transcriptional activator regulatory domain-containing protein n=1 Tax=Fonsecaea multimorphosa CBS 102226 TaxID=1442371 RepID=A0A0D2H9U9_9EURO|nr:uncharacterized protein Z520_05961 [Fonsecaea multimorphosa CBS 102226]KIX98660.1 hypothetical protein Z520_05961 [Fonsecaea multimorphosa CBS 102226]